MRILTLILLLACTVIPSVTQPVESNTQCKACYLLVDFLSDLSSRSNFDITILKSIASDYCIYDRIESKDVCNGIINEFTPEVLLIIKEHPNPQKVCQQLRVCSSDSLSSKPSIGYFIQLSDIHYDALYKIGSNTACGDPLCCRSGSGNAGYWGSVGCDTNIHLLTSALETLKQLYPNPDFIMWTGDAPAHDVWNQTQQLNDNASLFISSLFSEYYPQTPVVFTIGNHENFPSDQDAGPTNPTRVNNSDLIQTMIEAWGQWLSPDEIKEFTYGGYYSTLLKPGLRIISLNSDYGMYTNLWLVISKLDVADQISWLNNTLYNASINNESVWIISHSSLGDTTIISNYSNLYYQIIAAYPNIIKAGFHGHTHYDAFRIPTLPNKTPFTVEYIAPALTSYSGNFPSFRIYMYDQDRFEIVDYVQYFLNLTNANEESNTTAEWQISYQATEEYNMNSLSLQEWTIVKNQIVSEPYMMQRFCRNYFSQNPGSLCENQNSLRDLKCQISTFSYQQYTNCMQLQSELYMVDY